MSTHRVEKPNNRTMYAPKINDMYNKNQICLDTRYQREVVWQPEKMSALVDSMVNNYYIPPLIFAIRLDEDKQVVRYCIDGKQRITAITRFMNNVFPHIHIENGVRKEYYYASPADRNKKNKQGREYLPTALRRQFDSYEFFFVEYFNLTMDAEMDIFSRVQKGMPLTCAEKLKAHKSPNADLCLELDNRYRTNMSLLFHPMRSRIFQHIAHLMVVVHADSSVFPSSGQKVDKFLTDQTPPPDDLRRKMMQILDIVSEIAQSSHADVFTEVDGVEKPIAPLEFVCFGLYLSRFPRRNTRSIEDFAKDCHSLRSHIRAANNNKTPSMGSRCYQFGYRWVEDKLERLGVHPAMIRTPAEPSLTPDTEEYDEDEDMLETDLAHANPYGLINNKRKRGPECMREPATSTTVPATPAAARRSQYSRPVARRGGKFPRR